MLLKKGESTYPELPIQRILWVFSVTAVDNPVKRIKAFVLIKDSSTIAQLDFERVLIQRALLVRLLIAPVLGPVRLLDLITVLFVILVELVRVGVAFASLFLPASELFGGLARRRVDPEDFSSESKQRLQRERSYGLVTKLVGMEVPAKSVW